MKNRFIYTLILLIKQGKSPHSTLEENLNANLPHIKPNDKKILSTIITNISTTILKQHATVNVIRNILTT